MENKYLASRKYLALFSKKGIDSALEANTGFATDPPTCHALVLIEGLIKVIGCGDDTICALSLGSKLVSGSLK